MKSSLRKYFSRLGSIGGKKSRRILTSEQSKAMLAARKRKKKIVDKPLERL